MTTFLESAQSGVQKLFCDALRGGSNFAGLFPQGLGAGVIQDALLGAYGNVCSGDPSALPDLVPEIPFVGGQCPDLTYRQTVTVSYIRAFDNSPQTVSLSRDGLGGWSAPALVTVGSDWALRFSSGSGTFDSVLFNVAFVSGTPAISSIQICRVISGSLDCSEAAITTCGSLEPTIPPEDEISDSIDIDYDAPNPDFDPNEPPSETNPPTLPINLPDIPVRFFPPCINLDGIRIPFEFETPFGKVCGKIGLQPDIGDGVAPSIDIDLCPSQKEDLGLGEPDLKDFFEVSSPIGASVSSVYDGVLNQNFDLEELPIMGVFVESAPVNPTISQTALGLTGDKPNLIVPNIGYVIFEYLVQTSETGYSSQFSSDIPVKLTQQFIPCPWQFGAVGVKVRWASNWQGNYRLAKRKSCCDNCKSGSPQEIVDKLDRCRLD